MQTFKTEKINTMKESEYNPIVVYSDCRRCLEAALDGLKTDCKFVKKCGVRK